METKQKSKTREITDIIIKRGWQPNNFTYYLVESHLTASKVAYLMGMNAQTCYHWLRMYELPGAVNFIFLIARKMLLQGQDIFSNV